MAESTGSPVEADPGFARVQHYLLFGLSLPERALRTGAGLVGGAVRESAELLVPRAFQDSKTYSLLVRRTLDMVIEDVGGVEKRRSALPSPPTPDSSQAEPTASRRDEPEIENFVARKAVGNFIEMAGLATMHLSPIVLLAVISDVAYGSTHFLNELGIELKRQGVIGESATIVHAGDLLRAVSDASGVAASAFDTPPLSVEGLRATIAETTAALGKIDPAKVIPQEEMNRLWHEMREVAARDRVGILDVSTAMTLFWLNKLAAVGRGTLSGVSVAGALLDRHVLDHYRAAIDDIRGKGIYASLRDTSQPYVEAVWRNFAATKPTVTEDLLSGKLVGRAWQGVRRWLGREEPKEEQPKEMAPKEEQPPSSTFSPR
jgi:hypothetical protein